MRNLLKWATELMDKRLACIDERQLRISVNLITTNQAQQQSSQREQNVQADHNGHGTTGVIARIKNQTMETKLKTTSERQKDLSKKPEMTNLAKVKECFSAEIQIFLLENVLSTESKYQRAFIGISRAIAVDESDEKICLESIEPDEWIMDSGCSKHMTSNRKLFSTYKAYNGGNIIFGSNLCGNIIGKGQICDNKCKVTFSEHDSEITKNDKVIEPKNVNEALGDESWIVAMQEELNQFIANDVWELVPQPKNMTIIGTKWVFRNKLDENGIVSRNKARLVAQGYNQQEGIDYDETYAPVARLESIRILLAYACALDFKLFQMDVKSAFLNGFINEEVYVAQPPGFIDFEKPDHVYKLKKALYGLKQAPKACQFQLNYSDEGQMFVEFVIQNQLFSYSLETFAQILDVPCQGACVFTDRWRLDELAYGIPSDGPYQTNLPPIEDIISSIRIDREGQVRRIRHEEEIDVLEYQILTREIVQTLKPLEEIIRENVFCLGGNRDHVPACLCFMLYCVVHSEKFNLAYYMAKRIEWVTKQARLILPYGMLFIIESYQTFECILVNDLWIILFEINGKHVGTSFRVGTLLDIPFEGHCFYNNEWSLKSINNHNTTPTNDPLYTKLTHPTSIIYNVTKKRLNGFKFALEDPCNLFVEEACPYLKVAHLLFVRTSYVPLILTKISCRLVKPICSFVLLPLQHSISLTSSSIE
ncbi:retrovirus-related pol polyprotein from transposon TNT 1-94 [Tanacetum coccineum]